MNINPFTRRLGLVALALSGTLHYAQPAARAADFRTVALSGHQVPGAPDGVTYAAFLPPQLNDAGRTAFVAGLAGTGVDDTNIGGLWSEGSGSLAMVARGGSPAPGTPGLNFRDFGNGKPGLTNAGGVSFFGDLAGVNQYNERRGPGCSPVPTRCRCRGRSRPRCRRTGSGTRSVRCRSPGESRCRRC